MRVNSAGVGQRNIFCDGTSGNDVINCEASLTLFIRPSDLRQSKETW